MKSIGTLLLILSAAAACNAQGGQPSTPEERAKVVQSVQLLETDPLGKDAGKVRKWLKTWMAQKSEIAIPPCANLFQGAESEFKYSEELTFQLSASIAAFILERADSAEDPASRMTAGIVGMLKAYEAIAQKYTQPSEFLSSLIKARNSNQLPQKLREVMTRCSDVPLSDAIPRIVGSEILYSWVEVQRPARIKNLPKPRYPQVSMRYARQGNVELQVVLSSTGSITNIEVIHGSGEALTKSSIEAARAITFEPAMMRNRPVSTVVRVKYGFFAQ
jgi:TonB family protein